MDDSETAPTLLVRFRFDGEPNSNVANLTYEQYSNIKELPITVECKIVKNETLTLSKADIAALNKKISEVFSQSKSHTQRLSE
jgi:cytochrome c-type biogenesis protein CcmH/NrfF